MLNLVSGRLGLDHDRVLGSQYSFPLLVGYLVDSFPLPACQFARAYRCRRFKGEAAYGHDSLARQTFYGFPVHVRWCWPGVITRFGVAPANIHETALVPELTEATTGLLVGDRNYCLPCLEGV